MAYRQADSLRKPTFPAAGRAGKSCGGRDQAMGLTVLPIEQRDRLVGAELTCRTRSIDLRIR